MSNTVDKIQVRLVLDPKTHQRFRMIAAEAGKPMSAVARKIVEQFISERPVAREVPDPGGGSRR
jgi:hypothetical protein